ncbi:hypothetical protein KI387_011893, partial [Taxus chinensis]
MEECKCTEDSCVCELKMSRLMDLESVRNLHELIEKECDAVERTACQTAAGRALWKHVIHDPVAEILAGETHLKNLYTKMKRDRVSKASEISGVMLAVRTLWFDSSLEAALRCFQGDTQVVLLGAGMDARAYRLACLKDCTVFEVDLPRVLELKTALLQVATTTESLTLQAKSLRQVPADLTKKDWFDTLLNSGFLPHHNTVWILEGILYYLHDLNAKDVLSSISHKCKAHSILLADFMNECSTNLPHELKTNFHFYSDWPEELLPTLGYSQVKVSQIGDSDANFGLLMDPHNCFNKLRGVPRKTSTVCQLRANIFQQRKQAMEECKCSEDSCECEMKMSIMDVERVRNLHELIEKECDAVEGTSGHTGGLSEAWDFDLVQLVERDIEASSHTTVVVGTLVYLTPECVTTGKTSLESDMFSFGVVSIEIACGRRALDMTLRETHNM